jgi:hypothetical protein
LPEWLYDVATWTAYAALPAGVVLAFAVHRRWLLLAPLPLILVDLIMLLAGQTTRFQSDIDIRSPLGLVVFAISSVIIWDGVLLIGFFLRWIWEHRDTRRGSASGPFDGTSQPTLKNR